MAGRGGGRAAAAPRDALRCALAPGGRRGAPGGTFLSRLVRRRRLGGLGRGPRSRPRFRGATALEGGRPGITGAAGTPAAPRASARAPGGPGSGARHSQVPSERRPGRGPRICPYPPLAPQPPPLSFFGSVSGPATRRWGLTPSLRARELAARQRWKRDKSGTVCRRKFLMQLSAFADCLSKRLPGEGLRHVRYGN